MAQGRINIRRVEKGKYKKGGEGKIRRVEWGRAGVGSRAHYPPPWLTYAHYPPLLVVTTPHHGSLTCACAAFGFILKGKLTI